MSQDSRPAAIAGTLRIADGLTVNRLGFGAMQLPGPGVWGPPADPEHALTVLRQAVALGVDHIDTSDAYGPQIANALIREALYPYPEALVIATKVGVERDGQGAFVPAAAPAALYDQVTANLAVLDRPALDLVYLRVGGDGLLPPDPTPFAESFTALARLREQGLIRHVGLSGVTVDQLRQARAIAPVVMVQNRYHLLDRASVDVLRACEDTGIAFVPYFPLGAGMLLPGVDRSLLPPGMGLNEPQEQALDAIAARHRATRAQVILAWLLAHSRATLVIAGTRSEAHLKENLGAGRLSLGGDDIATLDAFG